jgi:predicted phosphohydrolase
MAIWAIADIHASRTDPATGLASKPMDIFGAQWEDHIDRIERAWVSSVRAADTVIVVGDIDWALHLEDALETLERLSRSPGRKVLVRGNHDFWWSSKTTGRIRKHLPDGISLIHNDSIQAEGFNICGTKGSPVPGGIDWTPEHDKLLNRERLRLRASLDSRDPGLSTIVAIHYPPVYPASGDSVFSELLETHGVDSCVYGHLHGNAAASGPHGSWHGVDYCLVAADAVDFRPVLVAEGGKLASRK